MPTTKRVFAPHRPVRLTFGVYSEPASAQNGVLWLREPGALDRFPLWAIFAITVLVIFLSIEIGFRSAHAVGRRSESEQRWPLEGIGAATLGLSAFMLAFTSGLAASRFAGSIVVGLFIASLNDVIDLHTKRLTQGRNRIPGSIWAALYVVAIFGMAEVGHHAGLKTTHRALPIVPLAITFSAVMFLIADLDRSEEGLLRVSQQSLIELQNSWSGSRL